MSTTHHGEDGAYAVFDCSRAQYDLIDAINQSSLKEMAKSPAHFLHKRRSRRKPPTPEMTLGSLVEHMAFGTEFRSVPSKFEEYRTNEAKAWKREQIAAGIAIVDLETVGIASTMAGRITSHPWFTGLGKFKTNIALVARHAETGIMQKGLVDLAPDSDLLIGDLKTTQDASPTERGFGASIVSYGYDIQGIVYQRLWNQVFNELRSWVLFAIESEPPHATSIQAFKQDDLDRAGRVWDQWMRTYKTCLDSGEWPAYSDELTWACVPAWRFKEV